MPKQPNDRYQQDDVRIWGTAETAGRFPTQPRYREARCGRGLDAPLSWAELNTLPAGSSSRRGLTAR
ncbi:DNA repair protein [Micromonospora sp. NPDC051925]|uniref:DNA repair protein n=1 Tax=Micromonospora sp. NPDC051925 TaxID=3364288 RepID=UPI0037C68C12